MKTSHLDTIKRWLLSAPLLSCCLLCAEDALVVKHIYVDCAEPKTVSTGAIQSHVGIKEGDTYDTFAIDKSVRALYDTGWFQSVKTESKEADGGVTVTFLLEPKLRLREIQFEGNKKYPHRRLKAQLAMKTDERLDEAKIYADIQTLKEFYRKRGYASTHIDYRVVRDKKLGTANIIFKIDEGKCQKIRQIVFKGNQHISNDRLRKTIETRVWGLMSFINNAGFYKQDTLQKDLDSLRNLFKNEGFLDVKIDESAVRLVEYKPGKLRVEITIQEGRRYYVGNIKISRNALYPKEKISKVLEVKPKAVFSPETVDKSCENIRNFYGHFGYLETYAEAVRVPNTETGAIDLEFVVHESEKYFVESVNIQGNTKTKTKVILHELALEPGDTFDLVKMKNSQARLDGTDFFEEVVLTPETTPVPNRKNLRVAVKEKATGGFQFGGGVDDREKFFAFVEYQQGNFDIANPRSYFQGAGQKFRLRTQIGMESSQLLVGFEEPWVMDRELAFGMEASRDNSHYKNAHHHELSHELDVYLRKRLFELVVGRLSYNIRSVDISHMKGTVSQTMLAEQGSTSVSKVGLVVYRDTRDNLAYPTHGNNVELGTQVAGGPLLGQTNYVRFEGGASQIWTVCEAGKQVVAIGARSGTVIPYGHKRVPLFERYSLGGSDTLRGFEWEAVGPRDPLDPSVAARGKTYSYATAEYSIKVMDHVRLATFYDAGYVNTSACNWSTHDYNSDWGVGLRIFILKAPLRLDLAFPIKSDTYNKRRSKFSFSFGTTF